MPLRPRSLIVITLLLLAFAPARAQQGGLTVIEIRVAGALRTQPLQVSIAVARGNPPHSLALSPGARLPAGVEILVPERSVILLRSEAGNTTELAAGSRFRVESTGAGGEWYTLIVGRLAMRVEQALNFFNVDFGVFVARVRGTDFELTVGDGQDGAARVTRGAVTVLREVATQIGSAAPLPMLASERLIAGARAQAGWSARLDQRQYDSPAAAARQYRQDLAEAVQAGDFDARLTAMNNLGLTAMMGGQRADAREWFQALLNLATQREDQPWRVRAMHQLAAADIRLQRWPDARVSLEQALAIDGQSAPVASARRRAQSEGHLGIVLRRLEQDQLAREATQRSIALYHQVDGPGDSAGIASNLENLGLLARRDVASALAWHSQALAMRHRLWGDQPRPETATSLGHVGDAWCAAGDFERGPVHLEAALAVRLAGRSPAPDAQLAQTYESLALCWAQAAAAGHDGANAKAMGYLQQARLERGP